MEFYFPTETGERLAFFAAAFLALIGLFIMFAPGLTLRLFALLPKAERHEGFAFMRFTGGQLAGMSMAALLLQQQWIYIAIAAAMVLGAFAIILSILSDHGASLRNFMLLVVVAALALAPALYVFALV